MIKRVMAIFMGVVLIVLFSACGNKKDEMIVTNESADEVLNEVETNQDSEYREESINEPVFPFSHCLKFPEGMNGYTNKYLIDNYTTLCMNGTFYVDCDGNEMFFSYIGPLGLGEHVSVGAEPGILVLKDSQSDYELRAWAYKEIDENLFDEYLEYSKENWAELAFSDLPYVEDGYYDIETSSGFIQVISEVENDTQKGYSIYMVDLYRRTFYQFVYVENIDIYDEARAMNLIFYIDFGYSI